jgi:ketosteroid isomerase-like protein
MEARMDGRAEIGRRRSEFEAAFNREDVSSLRQLCADDIVMIPPNQPPIFGIDASAEWWTIGFEACRSTMQIIPRELYLTDGWAFDWFDWSITIVPLCGAVTDVDNGSSFWVWRRHHDTAWRIIRSMWNSSRQVPSVWAGGVADFPIDRPPLM